MQTRNTTEHIPKYLFLQDHLEVVADVQALSWQRNGSLNQKWKQLTALYYEWKD